MADQFLGEIRMFSGNFAPTGWAFCNGQILPINQYAALFSLLGTFYGGNGTSNFALPNFQGAMPLGMGQGPGLSERVIGEQSGSASVKLLPSQIPSHGHAMNVSTAAATDTNASAGSLLAQTAHAKVYGAATHMVTMASQAISSTGSTLPHNNQQPYLAVSFIIALQGIYPPRA